MEKNEEFALTFAASRETIRARAEALDEVERAGPATGRHLARSMAKEREKKKAKLKEVVQRTQAKLKATRINLVLSPKDDRPSGRGR